MKIFKNYFFYFLFKIIRIVLKFIIYSSIFYILFCSIYYVACNKDFNNNYKNELIDNDSFYIYIPRCDFYINYNLILKIEKELNFRNYLRKKGLVNSIDIIQFIQYFQELLRTEDFIVTIGQIIIKNLLYLIKITLYFLIVILYYIKKMNGYFIDILLINYNNINIE
jgi:hypothetical protein